MFLSCRFRAVHEEVVKLDQDFGATFSGVLTDDEGRVRALWGSYAEQVRPTPSIMHLLLALCWWLRGKALSHCVLLFRH